DQNNSRIRKVSAAGTISTIAGDNQSGFKGDGGPAINAEVSGPADVSLDAAGNLYIADSGNYRIRKITGASPASGGADPLITTVANAFGEVPAIAPNTWVELKGTNLAPATRIWADSDFANNQMPTQLNGVSITVNGRSAFI